MNPLEFSKSIPKFTLMNHAERILLFAWYLQRYAERNYFGPSDIQKCFDEARIAPPSSISPFLNSIANRRKPAILKRNGSYTLEQSTLASLDRQYGLREATIHVDRLLSDLPNKISTTCEREYLEEAIICFRNKAFRAAIVMAWNVAYSHLCNLIVSTHLSVFNSQLPVSFPKARIAAISKIDDFQELKEHEVLQVCKSSGIVSASLHKVMRDKLDRRNVCAHPSGISVGQLTAEEYIQDLVANVILKS